MGVRIVTDSAADLPTEIADAKGIRVVPLTVRFGDDVYTSGVDLTTEEFWKKLPTADEPPATAAPSAGDFDKVYRELVEEGADGIVSIHLSSKLSATYQSATVAAGEFSDVPIEVVDTLGVSATTGLLSLHAAELAEGGSSAADIAASVEDLRKRTSLYGAIDTLEYLRRGGRIGGAQALLGTMLKVKPVVSIVDGIVEPVERVRTRPKSLEHLAGLVRKQADEIDRIVVLSGDAPDVDDFLSKIEGVVDVPQENLWALGPVVGTHSGPGVVGVVFTTRA